MPGAEQTEALVIGVWVGGDGVCTGDDSSQGLVESLVVLHDRGLDRISIGVQSFIDSEALSTQRRQTSDQVKAALTRIREVNFPTLNIDLIYGLPGQTVKTWLQSLKTALVFQPEELYLYPLYVRPLTGLGISDREWDDIRLACYRTGRDFLKAQGYTQVSMRMFRSNTAPETSAPVYCCQADGMIGLGCGARSYTTSLHYSNDYAVNAKEIKSIIEQYNNTEDFNLVNYGFELDLEEQKRRFILISVLSEEGLNLAAYRDRFHSEPLKDFPELQQLIELNLVNQNWKLTELGFERSDTFGSWLFSETVRSHSYSLLKSAGANSPELELGILLRIGDRVKAIHLSHNNGRADAHDLIPAEIWFASSERLDKKRNRR